MKRNMPVINSSVLLGEAQKAESTESAQKGVIA